MIRSRSLKCFVVVFFSIMALKSTSQISVSFYNSSLSKLGVAYHINNNVWAELRLYSNTLFSNITPEAILAYNALAKERVNVYVGAGIVVNYFTGVVVPVGLQFTPIEKFKNFSLHIEAMPTFDFGNEFVLQSSWGLRYKFDRK